MVKYPAICVHNSDQVVIVYKTKFINKYYNKHWEMGKTIFKKPNC